MLTLFHKAIYQLEIVIDRCPRKVAVLNSTNRKDTHNLSHCTGADLTIANGNPLMPKNQNGIKGINLSA